MLAKSFYVTAYASASLLLLAFVCTAILSIISSYEIPKKNLVIESQEVVQSIQVVQLIELAETQPIEEHV